MKTPKITIAIPTHNRARYLVEAMQSVMIQTFTDFTLLILDNASDDDSSAVVYSFSDPRIRYIRHEKNIGIVANWNQAIRQSEGEYLVILGDDDKLHPEFLSRSVAILDSDRRVGFTFCHCNKVNENGEFICLWGYDFPSAGFLAGDEYLVQTVEYGCCLTNSSTVMLRRSIFETVGIFKEQLAHNTFDFNMWIRIASAFDAFFIDSILVDYRLHSNQMSEIHWRTPPHPTGRLGTLLELNHAIAILLQNSKAEDPKFRLFLAQRLNWLNNETANLLHQFIPDL